MTTELMRDRLRWLARAAEAYALAEALHDREAKQAMFKIALMYEHIAARVERYGTVQDRTDVRAYRGAS